MANLADSVDAPDRGPGLVRGLGPVDAAMIVVGSMIGSGVFITSAESARLIGSPGWLLVAWALAGVLTIAGSLCCAELAAMMPKAGGQYVYLREAYGPAVGFLFGWSQFLVVQTGTIAAVAVAFAKFLGVFAPSVAADNYLIAPQHLGPYAVGLSTQQLVAVAMIALLTALNTRGLEAGKAVQNALTFIKTAALIGLIVVGVTVGLNANSAARTSSWWDPSANGWSPEVAQPGLGLTGGLALAMLLGRAMIGPLFSQSAWNNVTFTGGEVRDPGRNLPRALLLGCGMVVLLYMLANVAYVVALPLSDIQNAPSDRVATATMLSALGRWGALAMSAAILISTFGCNNGLILAGARVFYAMARDGLFFARAGTTNSRRVPAAALVAQGLWAALLTLPMTVAFDKAGKTTYGNLYGQILEYIIPADLIFGAMMVGAVILLRRRAPAADRPYRTPGHPLPALIYIALAALLVLDLLYLTPKTSGLGFAIVLAGIPVYLARSRFARGSTVPLS